MIMFSFRAFIPFPEIRQSFRVLDRLIRTTERFEQFRTRFERVLV